MTNPPADSSSDVRASVQGSWHRFLDVYEPLRPDLFRYCRYLTREEIAEALSTTVGAVKAALHRGRGKLVEPEAPETRAPAPAALDAFCEAFNARDLERLTALLLDTAAIEVVGVHAEYGPEAA